MTNREAHPDYRDYPVGMRAIELETKGERT